MKENHSNLAELFRFVAEKFPGRTALKDHTTELSYAELYSRAACVSAAIAANRLMPGSKIACISKKNVESIIVFWGIQLSGCIAVFLDHEDGRQTNESRLNVVKPAAIVMDAECLQQMTISPGIIYFDFGDIIYTGSAAFSNEYIPVIPPGEPDICYILLTSGTTGVPKAVQVTHTNVLHYTFAIYERIGRPVNVNAAHVSTFSADLGLTGLLIALVSGGMLRVMSKIESTDPALFTDVINYDQVSLIKITPTHLLSLLGNRYSPFKTPVQNIILGGEKLSWKTVDTICSLGVCKNLFNHYGPTETTIGALAFRIEDPGTGYPETHSVPIGTSLGDGICFLDEDATTGELFIAGPGVSHGYFNNEQESRERFVTRVVNGKSTICYRTGDICKRLPDGNYEFLYRKDRQVKIKGYRIELGEIEIALSEHPNAQDVTVLISDKDEYSILEAYIRVLEGITITEEDLRQWLGERLPKYKIPSRIYFYQKTPYNSNGKIDINTLRSQVISDVDPVLIEDNQDHGNLGWPSLVRSSWRNVLHKTSVALNDNFFETGGDSLLAIQLIGRLQRYGYKIHITDLNNNPILSDFIQTKPPRIINNDMGGFSDKTTTYLTVSQQKILHQKRFNPDHYCQTILFECNKAINTREMAIAFNQVLQCHLQLTTAFSKKDDVYSIGPGIASGATLGITMLDSSRSSIEQIQQVAANLLSEISVSSGKLFMAHVFIDLTGKDYIYLACNHLVVDVISWNIIIDELLDYYEKGLTGLKPEIASENGVVHFLNVAGRWSKGEGAEGKPMEVFHLPPPLHYIQYDNTVKVLNIGLPDPLSVQLHKLEESGSGTSVSGVLLAAFSAAILDELSLLQISVDVEFHGRPQHEDLPDLSRSVSWWATTAQLNLESEALSPAFCTKLIEKNAALANSVRAYTNALPAKPSEKPSEKPDILFNYLGRFADKFGNYVTGEFKPAPFNSGPTRSKNSLEEYKLYFTFRFIGNIIFIDVQYLKSYFSAAKISLIANRFFNHLLRYMAAGDHQQMRPSLLHSSMPSVGQPLYHFPSNSRRQGMSNPATLFLTGSTGFLGNRILAEVIKDHGIKIICLIRAKDQRHAEARLKASMQYYHPHLSYGDYENRITVLCGDLSLPQFGLDENDYWELATGVDIILHAAADTNLMKNYSDLIAANINATEGIITLAGKGRKKALHFVSTLAVSGYSPDGRSKNFSEYDFDYGQFFVSDYEKSKFEAEKKVRAFFDAGGAGRIYRVGHIAADSVTGKFQQNIDQNRIYQVIKGALLLKKVPRTYCEKISFSFIDVVASGIVLFATEMARTTHRCLHIENPEYHSFIAVADMLARMNYNIEVVEMNDFRTAVSAFDGSDEDKKTVALMYNWVQRFIDFPRNTNYVQRESIDLLARCGLYFPKIDQKWFSRMMHEAVKTTFLDPPPPISKAIPELSHRRQAKG